MHMDDLKNTKIWIGDNHELSRKVQERLFQLGFNWGLHRETIAQYTESRSLYLWSKGSICYHHSNTREEYFDGHPNREIHLWDLNLSSEGEYDENIGKKVFVQDAICGQISDKVGIIRDKDEYGYLIYQPGVEKTGSVHSPCVCYLESSVEGWFSQPEKNEFKEEWHLPEKWCVRITDENREVLKPWWEKRVAGTRWVNHKYFHFNLAVWLVPEHPYDDSHVYCIGDHPGDYTEITTEQFIKHVLKSDHMNTVDARGFGYATTPITNGSQTITRSALKEIWEVAQEGCFWKTELRNIAKRDEFSDTVTLTLDEVERMYRDASVAQSRTLDQYLTRPVEDKNAFVKEFRVESTSTLHTLSQELFGQSNVIEILRSATPADKPELKGKAFYISSGYKVEIGEANGGAGTYIAIFKK